MISGALQFRCRFLYGPSVFIDGAMKVNVHVVHARKLWLLRARLFEHKDGGKAPSFIYCHGTKFLYFAGAVTRSPLLPLVKQVIVLLRQQLPMGRPGKQLIVRYAT